MDTSVTYMMTNKIGAAGFATVTMDELNQLAVELELNTIAAKEASKFVSAGLIDLVATNASNRAVKQAINHLAKPESGKQLASYLKIYSRRWATQYAKRAAKGKSVPETDLQWELLLLSAPVLEALVESATTDVELSASTDEAEALDEIAEQKKTSDLNLKCFEQVLIDHEFVYERENDSVRLEVRCGNVMANLQVRANSAGILLTTSLPVLVSKDHRPGVSAGIQFANWKLTLGNFEFHEKSGTVRFRNSAPLAATPCPKQFAGLLFSSLFALRQYALGIVQLALGNGDPISTMKLCATQAENNL